MLAVALFGTLALLLAVVPLYALPLMRALALGRHGWRRAAGLLLGYVVGGGVAWSVYLATAQHTNLPVGAGVALLVTDGLGLLLLDARRRAVTPA